MTEAIYKFGKGIDTGMFDNTIVGGKGAKLAEMGSLGLPVPPGVTIPTGQCNNYLCGTVVISDLVDGVLNEYESIAETNGYMPLVSVRSGARVSMPGMMDTVLNVGINDDNISEWVDRLGEECAFDCYRRLIEMYSEVVIGIPAEAFQTDEMELPNIVSNHLEVYEELTGEYFPQAIEEQLAGAIEAVFNSWNSERACAYRAIHGYPDWWGTAVNIQQMVFGNRNNKSASGVLFSRDFNTGDEEIIVDWLPNAQGEDVVSGTHTPNTFKYSKTNGMSLDSGDVINEIGSCFYELVKIAAKVEAYYRDMQDMEFTIDNGELFILQTRDGKRSALAAFKIAWDLHMAGTINQAEAIARVTGKQYIALHNPTIDPSFTDASCVEGVPASGNIVTGIAVTSSADALSCKEDCILVAEETTPTDFPGMAKAVGVLTRTGGITSHAAVVARGMDKTCVVGAENLKIEGLAGKQITIDGATGRIWIDKSVPVVFGDIPGFVDEMIGWATEGDTSFISVAPESVSTGQTAYVDVSGSLGTVKSLTEALVASKGANGILGFGQNDPTPAEDTEFMGFFGIDPRTYDAGTYVVIEKVLTMKKWTKTFKKAYTLHLPVGTPDSLLEVIRAAGWKLVTTVNSFKAALTANGYVQMDEAFLQQLTREKLDFSVIEDLIKKAGGEVTELPPRVTKNRLMFDVLGG